MIVEVHGEVITFGGIKELSAASAEMFRKDTHAAVSGHNVIEVDLSQTMVIDCAGLGALIALRNLARDRKARIRWLNPTIPVQLFCTLVRVAHLCETLDASKRVRSSRMAPPGLQRDIAPAKTTMGSNTGL